MRIEENKIFEFKFPYYGNEISIPIRAQSRELAAEELKNHITSWMMDLAMEFPKTAPVESTPQGAVPSGDTGTSNVKPPEVNVPSYALELDIEQLVREIMPIKKPAGANTIDVLVKKWTGFKYSTENYPAIIEELKKVKAGL